MLLDCISDVSDLKLSRVEILSQLDYLFYLHGNSQVSINTIHPDDLDRHQITLPPDLTIEDLHGLSPRNISNVLYNIRQARNKLINHLSTHNLASPRKDQLLREWQQDCQLYNSGMNGTLKQSRNYFRSQRRRIGTPYQHQVRIRDFY